MGPTVCLIPDPKTHSFNKHEFNLESIVVGSWSCEPGISLSGLAYSEATLYLSLNLENNEFVNNSKLKHFLFRQK